MHTDDNAGGGSDGSSIEWDGMGFATRLAACLSSIQHRLAVLLRWLGRPMARARPTGHRARLARHRATAKQGWASWHSLALGLSLDRWIALWARAGYEAGAGVGWG